MSARAAETSLSVALSPTGILRVAPPAAADPAATEPGAFLEPAVAARLAKAFARGTGAGLLHLGASETATRLPPAFAYFRDLGHLFMERLSALPDLASFGGPAAETLDVPPPKAELDRFVLSAPPMPGAEYLGAETLTGLWREIETAARAELARAADVERWLHDLSPVWNLVGRVHLHLAENRRDEKRPFAFLATYTAGVSSAAKVQHVPLGRAVRDSASAADKKELLKLLEPVQRAAKESALVRRLVDSGELFHPLAWTPREAYAFLKEVPLLTSSGVVVRVPDWWNARRPPRPEMRVSLGPRARGAGLSADQLLDFSVDVAVGDVKLTKAELQTLLAGTDGLVPLKGRWVEVDRERLKEVLEHWKRVERLAKDDGLSFGEGMRLLSGAALPTDGAGGAVEAVSEWTRVVATGALARALADLRDPAHAGFAGSLALSGLLKTTLRPYQETGVAWLHTLVSLGLGGCLADDMGLGKTVQLLALLLGLKKRRVEGPHLLVAPASLLGNWTAEIARFAPSLSHFVAHPSAVPSRELADLPAARLDGIDLVLTTYGSLHRVAWLQKTSFGLVVLDEAQAIKNAGARQSRSAKALKGRVRFALTGTPVENRLADLWSLFDFLQPGLLGPAETFHRFAKRLGERGDFGPLRRLVGPYVLRRLKTDKSVVADLPDKTEVTAYCGLSKEQVALYQKGVKELERALQEADGMKRRGVILAFLTRFKQICNHPAHWLGAGTYAPAASGKFQRLGELAREIAEKQEKALVFTQFREITAPLASFLAGVFGRPGLVLHGETAVGKRKGLVDAFQEESGPPFFVLSLKAGGTGLNLTAASHVVHFDRWWNPAVENQATDRAFRIGQRKNVLVHKFVCKGTVEERIDALIEGKKTLAKEVLDGGGETLLTEMTNAEILRLVSLDVTSALDEG